MTTARLLPVHGRGADRPPQKHQDLYPAATSQAGPLNDEGGRKEGTQTVEPHPLADAGTMRSLACRSLQSYVK